MTTVEIQPVETTVQRAAQRCRNVVLVFSLKTFVKHVQQRSVSLANGLLYALLIVSIKRCLYDQVFLGRKSLFYLANHCFL